MIHEVVTSRKKKRCFLWMSEPSSWKVWWLCLLVSCSLHIYLAWHVDPWLCLNNITDENMTWVKGPVFVWSFWRLKLRLCLNPEQITFWIPNLMMLSTSCFYYSGSLHELCDCFEILFAYAIPVFQDTCKKWLLVEVSPMLLMILLPFSW